jgi:hypothetical protein
MVSVCPDTAVVTVPDPAILSVLPMPMSMVVESSAAMPMLWSRKFKKLLSACWNVNSVPLASSSVVMVLVLSDLVVSLAL